jgi:branched-chain amino acid aminotransferase
MKACGDTLKANGLEEGYLRPVVFVGEGAMGIFAPNNPNRTTVVAWKWGAYLGDEALKSGIRVKISSFARHHINVGLAKAKMMGQYTNSILAKREAKFGGYDEAILLDPAGYVSEGSGENIFIVKKGLLITPDLSSSILEGITRDTVITLAREMGLEVKEARITRDQLWLADECFFIGTAAEITPVREVDNRAIGEGKVGPITKKLQDKFFAIVRGNDDSPCPDRSVQCPISSQSFRGSRYARIQSLLRRFPPRRRVGTCRSRFHSP